MVIIYLLLTLEVKFEIVVPSLNTFAFDVDCVRYEWLVTTVNN